MWRWPLGRDLGNRKRRTRVAGVAEDDDDVVVPRWYVWDCDIDLTQMVRKICRERMFEVQVEPACLSEMAKDDHARWVGDLVVWWDIVSFPYDRLFCANQPD